MMRVFGRRTLATIFAIGLAAGCGAYDDVKDEVDELRGDDEGLAGDDVGPADSPDPEPTEPPTSAPAPTPAPPAPPPPTPAPAPPPPSPNGVPADFAGVQWLHTNVSGWAETASLRVSISSSTITLDYDKARTWPAVGGLNANPWIFVFQDGQWYAATFEWFRFGQVSKPTRTVAGDHIKRKPLHNFKPRSGERYGFMVSGLARDSKRNVQERTPVVMATWP